MLLRAVIRRCPRCGSGKLFRHWFTMVERCPRCGMKFEREEGFFLGAYVVNFGAMMVAIAAFIAIGMAVSLPDPNAGKLALGGVAVGILVPILFYPISKTVWSAVDLLMKPLEPKEVEAALHAAS
jgi:uncharacterized protein (DUF983 family)